MQQKISRKDAKTQSSVSPTPRLTPLAIDLIAQVERRREVSRTVRLSDVFATDADRCVAQPKMTHHWD